MSRHRGRLRTLHVAATEWSVEQEELGRIERTGVRDRSRFEEREGESRDWHAGPILAVCEGAARRVGQRLSTCTMRKRTSTTHLLPPRDEFSSRWPCRRSFCQPRAGHRKLTLRKVRPRVQVLAVPEGRRESARQSKLTYQGSCRSKYTASGLNRHHRAGRRPTHVRRLASLAQNPPRAAFDPASPLFGQPLVL